MNCFYILSTFDRYKNDMFEDTIYGELLYSFQRERKTVFFKKDLDSVCPISLIHVNDENARNMVIVVGKACRA